MLKNLEPYYYLDGLVNVLLIDDDPGIIEMMKDIFEPFRIFNLKTATSSSQAEKILNTPERVHIAILDLGLKDIKNDEFYLLKHFANRVSFVMFTGATSTAKGFEAHENGAKAIIEKRPDFDVNEFIDTMNRLALLTIINPRYEKNDDSLNKSTDILFDKSPRFVSQWAQALGLTDRALRHMWTKNLGANTKIILSIYQIFTAAFKYYRQFFEGGINKDDKHLKSTDSYKHLEEFFHTHKSSICDYIAYGDIASLMR